ncbi:MAG: hypothetical protein GKR87_06530 [Kiritimatiellae bacterium]|nr:hypothetical protein [Kiritimatiellia bacterium]
MKVFGAFSKEPNFSGMYQNFDTEPGTEWKGNVSIQHHAENPLKGKNEAFPKIKFYDVYDGLVSAEEPTVKHTMKSPTDTFVEYTIHATAPAEVVTVRFTLMFAQWDGKATGLVYFDDATFEKVEETLK